jgi:hypothetical protein
MFVENPMWGAPRIHGELLMSGFYVSERTISRWMKRSSRDPGFPMISKENEPPLRSARVLTKDRSIPLDHIIAIDERHLKRLISEYIRHYHDDRTHLGLEQGTPNDRNRAIASGRVLSRKRLGGCIIVTIGLLDPSV